MSAPPNTDRRDILALVAQYEGRRAPFDYAPGEGLPDADIDLEPLTRQSVADPASDPMFAPPVRSSFHRKQIALRTELQGFSELCVLHGLLVAHLRKRSFPEHAPYLFHRLWDEHADHLLAHLDARWLVSAVTTFGDHGLSPTQRSTGLAMTALFGAMKLYESERLYSGLTPNQPFALEGKARASLALDMDAYALSGGGLDVNLIARLWQEAEGCAVIAPLAQHLLRLLLSDERTVIHRLSLLRAEKLRAKEGKATPGRPAARVRHQNPAPIPSGQMPHSAHDLRWGTVSTIKAPLAKIARFAAHHLDLGAAEVHIYLDAPDPHAEAFLRRHPRITLTTCDDAYWQAQKRGRMQAHQLRQTYNATRCYTLFADDLHWLAHIDVDEFLLSDTPLNERLFATDPRAAFMRIAPIEALARDDGLPVHFKRAHVHAGVKKSALQDIYPTFGMHLYGGFLSHTSGKIFTRTGIPETRLGIHSLKYRGADADNRDRPKDLFLAHLHAPSWEAFRAHLAFRREHGSYRARTTRPELGQAQLFDFLQDEGDTALRAFFDEVVADTPQLRDKLSAHGMLVHEDLDLDAKVRRVFGEVPK